MHFPQSFAVVVAAIAGIVWDAGVAEPAVMFTTLCTQASCVTCPFYGLSYSQVFIYTALRSSQADFVTETRYVSAVYHMCFWYMYSLDCDWYRFEEMLNVDACADQCVQCTLTIILSMSTILSGSPEVPTLLRWYIAHIVLNVCMPGTTAA